MHFRMLTSTPQNFTDGSGTFVGITTLARALRGLGVTVEIQTANIRFPIYTLRRVLFNESLRFKAPKNCDTTIGFDMDGYAAAKKGGGFYAASIKGVIADELRFESGLTRATMRIQATFEKRNVRKADLVLTTSQYASARVQELYGLARTPSVVPELIDLAAWNELFSRNAGAPNPHMFVVLSVCRFYPRKRLNILLLAAQRLRNRVPGLEVRIVGDGPEAARLKDFCNTRGLQGVVHWLGNVSPSQLAKEYNECDIFCLPSVQEGFGIVFLEAMAAGKSIVAARAAAVPEVVKHGLLAEPSNENSLAEAIERLYLAPELRKSLGEAGKEFVKQFDAPVVARLFLSEIESALALRSGRARRHE